MNEWRRLFRRKHIYIGKRRFNKLCKTVVLFKHERNICSKFGNNRDVVGEANRLVNVNRCME